jgi:hypothetical protein
LCRGDLFGDGGARLHVRVVVRGGALVSVGRGAIKAQSKRRAANVFWDVIAFWPHSVHPFAPPAYSQAAVLHFRDRIRFHLYGQKAKGDQKPGDEPTTTVVVAAHSQGSLIAIAALMWLTPEEREHVGFVTFGSQLQLMFSRAFPDYVNYGVLKDLLDDDSLDRRWVNLYRETDPIAGPVLSWRRGRPAAVADMTSCGFTWNGAPAQTEPTPDLVLDGSGRRVCGPHAVLDRGCDWRLLDPAPARNLDTAAETSAVAATRGHSQFFADPEWDTAVDAVRSLSTRTVPAADDEE